MQLTARSHPGSWGSPLHVAASATPRASRFAYNKPGMGGMKNKMRTERGGCPSGCSVALYEAQSR